MKKLIRELLSQLMWLPASIETLRNNVQALRLEIGERKQAVTVVLMAETLRMNSPEWPASAPVFAPWFEAGTVYLAANESGAIKIQLRRSIAPGAFLLCIGGVMHAPSCNAMLIGDGRGPLYRTSESYAPGCEIRCGVSRGDVE